MKCFLKDEKYILRAYSVAQISVRAYVESVKLYNLIVFMVKLQNEKIYSFIFRINKSVTKWHFKSSI